MLAYLVIITIKNNSQQLRAPYIRARELATACGRNRSAPSNLLRLQNECCEGLEQIYIICETETWLHKDFEHLFIISSFDMFLIPRRYNKAGSLCLYVYINIYVCVNICKA